MKPRPKQLTDDDLTELGFTRADVERWKALGEEFLATVRGVGVTYCPSCNKRAVPHREGREFHFTCECGWSIAGTLPDRAMN
jgi:hypothetical protein